VRAVARPVLILAGPTASGKSAAALALARERPVTVINADALQVYRDLAKLPDVTFMPFYLDGVAGLPQLNIADGMHPNAEGARIIERAMWERLEPLLDKSPGPARSGTK